MADTRLLGQRYEIGDELGYGGMAEVFRARDTRLGRDVAVKILRADLARDPSFIGRFRREAQAAAGLNHPNIVGVYDTGEEAGTPYIVMEFVVRADPARGRWPMTAGCCRGGRWRSPPRDVQRRWSYSHRAGIVHRDIKPGERDVDPDAARSR